MDSQNMIFFLRHAETEKDPNIPATDWVLSGAGKNQAEEISKTEEFSDVDVIISSAEEKSYLTAKPLAENLGKETIRMSEFDEMKRGDVFLPKEEFEKLKREKLEDPDCKKDGGESGREALKRFESGVEKIDHAYNGKNILVVSHGTILALYFAKLSDNADNIYERWQKTKFCTWGMTENGILKKDICHEI